MVYNPNNKNLRSRATKSYILILSCSTIFLFSCLAKSSLKKETSNINPLIILKLLEVYPHKHATSVNLNTTIVLKFNTQLDQFTLKTNTLNNTCFGTIQITFNNFRTCVIMKKIALVNEDKNILLKPKGVYNTNTVYKIRIRKEIRALNGSSLDKDLIISEVFRTTWSHQFGTSGNDSGISISVDKKENIYLAGLTHADESGERKDLFLTKFVKSGHQRWIIQPGFGRIVSAANLSIKNYNKIILSAYSNDKENPAVILGKFSLDGVKDTIRTIPLTGKSRGNGLTVDNEGNIYVTDATPFDILKINEKGNKIWGNELSSRTNVRALAADKGGNLYITGSMTKLIDSKITKEDNDIFLLKISQMGPKIWHRTYRSQLNDAANSIAINSEKAIAIVGYVTRPEYSQDTQKGNRDAFVAKYNTEGELKWIHTFKGEKLDECTVSMWTLEGDLLVGGFTQSTLGDENNIGKEDNFLAKFNNNGNLQWLRQFGTKENERPLGLAEGSAGQIYVTGFSEGQIDGAKYNGGRDIFIVKFDANGIKQ